MYAKKYLTSSYSEIAYGSFCVSLSVFTISLLLIEFVDTKSVLVFNVLIGLIISILVVITLLSVFEFCLEISSTGNNGKWQSETS